jgi:SnoaL-like domain
MEQSAEVRDALLRFYDRLSAGEPVGYEEGSLGWVVDEPTFFFPDGSAMQTRLTAVLHREDGTWKLLHMHVSVGVPDDEVVELQKRWSSAS